MNKLKKYLIIFIPLLVGGIVSLLVPFDLYQTINKPVLSPPKIVFPIVWSILYLMMGISLFLVLRKEPVKINKIVFAIQLLLNVIWSFVFFKFKLFLLAFIIIICLVFAIVYNILIYYNVSKLSTYLLIPYLGWVIFASYLNFEIFLLN